MCAVMISAFIGLGGIWVEALSDGLDIGLGRAAALIGRLMLTVPEIIEIDVNPLVVHPRGQGVTALDALIVTR